MRYKRRFGFFVALMMVLVCVSAGLASADDSPALTIDALAGVIVEWADQTSGENNISLPTLVGHPDETLQQSINQQLAERLHAEELERIFGRVQQWAGDEGNASGIHMQGEAKVVGNLLSLVVSIRGELFDGSVGQMYETFNCDLLTGQTITLADLFEQPEAAVAEMEALVRASIEQEGINSYMERSDVTPLPLDAFSANARGLTVYYPGQQYRLISGNSGTFLFAYHQLEQYMKQSPIRDALLAQTPKADNPAEQVMLDVDAGILPGIPAQLGTPMAGYIELYRLIAEPDYTLDGPLYQFEAPQMQGVRLSAAMYPEDPADTSESVMNIRATLIDLYGLRPGVSTLLDVADLLGRPDETTTVDEEMAFDMLLTQGDSFWYDGAKNRIEFHGDENGVLSAVILHVGD